MINLRAALLLALGVCAGSPLAETAYTLWPDQAPGAIAPANTPADTPTITSFLPSPDSSNGAAIIICPGGGYWFMAGDHEGADVARWYRARGFAAFVLKYRIAPYKHPVPMWDVQRAVRFVRSRAEQWKIDTSRVGLCGFSAGGHLASTGLTYYTPGNPAMSDSIERLSSRPSFGILIYPVITMDAAFTHMETRTNLLGSSPSQALIDSMSTEKQVTTATPPVFLVHSVSDDVVPVKNSQVFYDSCVAHNVDAWFYPLELSCGWHGFGMACGNWADSSFVWLSSRGLVSQQYAPAPRNCQREYSHTIFTHTIIFRHDRVLLRDSAGLTHDLNGQRIKNLKPISP